jgi:hypothetical protein
LIFGEAMIVMPTICSVHDLGGWTMTGVPLEHARPRPPIATPATIARLTKTVARAGNIIPLPRCR